MFTSELVTKDIPDYQMPEQYRKEALNFLIEAINLFGNNNFLFFAITGSCALEFCIDGWSNINAMIVTKEFDPSKNKSLYCLCGNHTIQIVPTLLTKDEFETSLLDDEARVVMWQLGEKMIKPNYVFGKMSIPKITLMDIQGNDKTMLPVKIQEFKNLLWQDNYDKRKLIRALYTIIKMSLRTRGHIAYSYSGAFKKFAEIYGGPKFDIYSEIISRSNVPSAQFINYAGSVIGRLTRRNT